MNSTFAKLSPAVLKNLSAVSLHKVAQIAGTTVTIALIPRLFGPEDYGRFAFVLSLSFLGQILGDFGTLDVMGKFVPAMSAIKARQFYMRHLAFKLLVGLACGIASTGAALLLGNWMTPGWAALVGAGVFVHLVAWVPFHFSLGLGRVGIWMAEQAWRQWVLLGLLLIFLPAFGFGGALLALLLMELLFCLGGLWAARAHWHWPEFRFDRRFLAPYVRFGFGFFLANLTTVALYRSGPLLVESLTGDSAQTGYLNLALGLFLLAYITAGQFAQSLIPSLSNFLNQGDSAAVRRWLNNFVYAGWIFGWVGVVLVWVAARGLTPLVFGADFAPAAACFKWISLGIPLAVLLWAGNVVATVTGRGRTKFGASLVALVLFIVVTFLLVPAWGAAGASMALVLAVASNVTALLIALRPDFAPNWWMLSWTSAIGVFCLLGASIIKG